MKIFVTGGLGFIGSNLVKNLASKGNEVVIFDNFSNPSKNYKEIKKTEGCSIIEGDITTPNVFDSLLKNSDLVIHLAAMIDVTKSITNPKFTKKINVEGTKNLLTSCIKNDVKNFIAASSAAVYGTPKKLPINENSPLIPISPYGESKMEMEFQIEKISKTNNINTILLRFFNIYGKGQTPTYAGVITKFMNCIKNNTPLIIFGDGSYTRDFIYISDVVRSIEKSIEKISEKKSLKLNIASGNKIAIKDLAQLMLSISLKKLDIIHKPAKLGDIPHSQANIELAKQELDFIPKISLKEGLENLLQPDSF